jgi:hypothetical protein
MQLSLTRIEIDMLLDAANRMEAEDLWGEGEYTEQQSDALLAGACKLRAALLRYKQENK